MNLKKRFSVLLVLFSIFLLSASFVSAESIDKDMVGDSISISEDSAISDDIAIADNSVKSNDIKKYNENNNQINDINDKVLNQENQNSVSNNINTDYEGSISSYGLDIVSDNVSVYTSGDPIYVALNGSDQTGNGSDSNPYQSISYAIKQSTNGTIIYVNAGNYSGELNTNISITNKNITIESLGNAQDTFIDGSNDNSIGIFSIYSSIFTLNGFTLANENNGITSNITKGAIFVYNDSAVYINNCIFTNNSASNGGAITNWGNLTIAESNFSNNTASSGGAIYNIGNITMKDSEFATNNASFGSAIANIGFVWDSNKSTNNSNYSESNLNIDNCNFLNNNGVYGTVSNEIRNYMSNSNSSANLKINNSEFKNNTAEYGGAIYNRFYSDVNSTGDFNNKITLNNVEFNSNNASYGGAIYNSINTNNGTNNTVDFNIENCNFNNNVANVGGAIFQLITSNGTNKANIKAEECNFINNSAINANGGNIVYSSGSNDSDDSCLVNISYSNIIDNGVSLSNYLGSNIIANYNWWGTNANIINKTAGSDINTSNKVIATITPENASNLTDYANNISVYLKYYEDSEGNLELLNKYLPNRTVSFSTNPNTGSFSKNNVSFVNGEASTVYSNASDYTTVNAVIDNQVFNLNVIPIKNVTATSIIVNNFTTVKLSGENFTAKLLDAQGNSLIGYDLNFVLKNSLGETKTYIRTTNIEGIAKLALNLAHPDNYFITVTFNGQGKYDPSNSTEAKVLITESEDYSVLIADDVITQRLSGQNFTVKLVDNQNNPIVGRDVSIVLKNSLGETKEYIRTTNTEGIAKLAINLAHPDVYYLISSFGGDSTFASANPITNTLTITN